MVPRVFGCSRRLTYENVNEKSERKRGSLLVCTVHA